jgi:hypothetical protein
MPFRYEVSLKRSLISAPLYFRIAPRTKKTDLADVPPYRLPSGRCRPATPGLTQLPKVLSRKERETSNKKIDPCGDASLHPVRLCGQCE